MLLKKSSTPHLCILSWVEGPENRRNPGKSYSLCFAAKTVTKRLENFVISEFFLWFRGRNTVIITGKVRAYVLPLKQLQNIQETSLFQRFSRY